EHLERAVAVHRARGQRVLEGGDLLLVVRVREALPDGVELVGRVEVLVELQAIDERGPVPGERSLGRAFARLVGGYGACLVLAAAAAGTERVATRTIHHGGQLLGSERGDYHS